MTLPKYVSGIYSLTITPGPTWWLRTRQGAQRSTDGGQTWQYILGGLPTDDVLAVRYDAEGHRLLATAAHTRGVFESKDNGRSWQRSDTAVSIRSVINYQGRLLGHRSTMGCCWNRAATPPLPPPMQPVPRKGTRPRTSDRRDRFRRWLFVKAWRMSKSA